MRGNGEERESWTGDGAREDGDCDDGGGLAVTEGDIERPRSYAWLPLTNWMGRSDAGLRSGFTRAFSSSSENTGGTYNDISNSTNTRTTIDSPRASTASS